MNAILPALTDPDRPSISFEFFPPKTDQGELALWKTIAGLVRYRPTFVSVTYGAGGSSRDRTVGITANIQARTGLDAMAHLTCVQATQAEVMEVVDALSEAGVRAIMALRGDPPAGFGAPWTPTPGGFNHASDLIAALRDRQDPSHPYVIGVAAFPEGHPESASLDEDARWLAYKLEQADFAITQMFFEVDLYVALVERVRAHGCTKPIIPGIMPPQGAQQIAKMVAMSGGAVPEGLIAHLSGYDQPEDQAKAGIVWATQFAQNLLDQGAPGLHLYTLNKQRASQQLVEDLGLAQP